MTRATAPKSAKLAIPPVDVVSAMSRLAWDHVPLIVDAVADDDRKAAVGWLADLEELLTTWRARVASHAATFRRAGGDARAVVNLADRAHPSAHEAALQEAAIFLAFVMPNGEKVTPKRWSAVAQRVEQWRHSPAGKAAIRRLPALLAREASAIGQLNHNREVDNPNVDIHDKSGRRTTARGNRSTGERRKAGGPQLSTMEQCRRLLFIEARDLAKDRDPKLTDKKFDDLSGLKHEPEPTSIRAFIKWRRNFIARGNTLPSDDVRKAMRIRIQLPGYVSKILDW